MNGLTVAQVLSQTFNGRVEWSVPGSYIKILTAAANLQLEAFKGGVLVLLAPTVKAGFYQRVDFDRIVVTNTGAQLTEILIAPDQGGSDAFTANSVITSPLLGDNADGVAVSGAASLVGTLARNMAFNGTTWDRVRSETLFSRFAMRVSEQGFPYGASYKSNTALTPANTADTVFSAASNVNGAILWRASFYTHSVTAAFRAGFQAHTSAPTTAILGDVLTTQDSSAFAAGLFAHQGRIERPIFIAAGKGCYFLADLAESAAYRAALYTLL